MVLGGCGAAVLAAGFMPDTHLGIGLVGVSLAFGLTVLTGIYALGHVPEATTWPSCGCSGWRPSSARSSGR